MRNLSFLAVCLILVISVNTALGLPGSGTQEDPWRIESLADFNEFAADPNYWDGHTRLEADVNLAGQTYTTAVIAPDTNSVGGFQGPAFTGVFDGNGHKFTTLTINDGGAGNDFLGLFGQIGEVGEVKNLGIENYSVTGGNRSYYLGGLVGTNLGIVTNCYSTGDVSGEYFVGGLVGYNSLSGSISNCYSTGYVSGDWYVGGLVGSNRGIVSNCYSTGDVSGTGDYVGGLVGENRYGSISNCYSTGDVNGTDWWVGGLVGWNRASVSNCYSTGDVSGEWFVGGLVGDNDGSVVSNCYSTGSVSGDDAVGGLVGLNFGGVLNCYSTGDVDGNGSVGGLVGDNWGDVSNCYSTGYVNGHWYVGGLVGYNYGDVLNCYSTSDVSGTGSFVAGLVGLNYGGVLNCFWDIDTQTHGVTESIGFNTGEVTNVEGLPTNQMQDINTYLNAGWDFTTPIWKMCELPDYPKLWWEKCPIEADVSIEPKTLNLASKGKWLTCHIRLPEDYSVTDIDPNSIYLEDVIKAQGLQLNDQFAISRFSRTDVQAILDVGDNFEVAISGELTDGTAFAGTDTIRVLDK